MRFALKSDSKKDYILWEKTDQEFEKYFFISNSFDIFYERWKKLKILFKRTLLKNYSKMQVGEE